MCSDGAFTSAQRSRSDQGGRAARVLSRTARPNPFNHIPAGNGSVYKTTAWFAFVGAGLSALTLPSAPVQAQQVPQSRNWSGIERCAGIADAVQRHSCLDNELAALGLLSQAAASEAAVVETQPPPLASRNAPPPSVTRQRTPNAEPVFSGLTSTVRSARMIGRGLVEVIAENGTGWRSISSTSLSRAPRAGVPFAVEPGALGSYNCRIEASTYFKCNPVSSPNASE